MKDIKRIDIEPNEMTKRFLQDNTYAVPSNYGIHGFKNGLSIIIASHDYIDILKRHPLWTNGYKRVSGSKEMIDKFISYCKQTFNDDLGIASKTKKRQDI